MTGHHLLSRVAGIIDAAVRTAILPRFRLLRPDEIEAKDTPGDPDDLVTIVDTDVERYLIDALGSVVPGAAFIGEEAAGANPALLDALSAAAPVWLIDPIDGTKNFARGSRNFGVMLALVENGRTSASWMAVPAARPAGYTIAASRGGGAWIDGLPATTRGTVRPPHPRGTLHDRMMPASTARGVSDRLRGRYEAYPSTGSAATEYSAIVRGDKDFVIYYRLLPWDHAPGALAVVEAGGAAIHLSGEPYRPHSPNQVTIFAATPELADAVRGWLNGL